MEKGDEDIREARGYEKPTTERKIEEHFRTVVLLKGFYIGIIGAAGCIRKKGIVKQILNLIQSI